MFVCDEDYLSTTVLQRGTDTEPSYKLILEKQKHLVIIMYSF